MSDRTTARHAYHLHQRRQPVAVARQCPTTRVRYDDRIGALLTLATIQRKDATSRPATECRAYHCSRCNGWHLSATVR
jgi:hypothetical protein